MAQLGSRVFIYRSPRRAGGSPSFCIDPLRSHRRVFFKTSFAHDTHFPSFLLYSIMRPNTHLLHYHLRYNSIQTPLPFPPAVIPASPFIPSLLYAFAPPTLRPPPRTSPPHPTLRRDGNVVPAQRSAAQRSTAQHSTAQHSTAQHSNTGGSLKSHTSLSVPGQPPDRRLRRRPAPSAPVRWGPEFFL